MWLSVEIVEVLSFVFMGLLVGFHGVIIAGFFYPVYYSYTIRLFVGLKILNLMHRVIQILRGQVTTSKNMHQTKFRNVF